MSELDLSILSTLRTGRMYGRGVIQTRGICYYIGTNCNPRDRGTIMARLDRLFETWAMYSGVKQYPIFIRGSGRCRSAQFAMVRQNGRWTHTKEYVKLRFDLLDHCIAELENTVYKITL